MQQKNILIIIVIIVILLAGGIYFVMQKPHNPTIATPTPTPAPAQNVTGKETIKISATKSGIQFLTDAAGITLYHTLRDSSGNGNSTCTGQCAITWSPFYTDSIVVSDPLKASYFKTIIRTDGKKQTTYRGWPLYYYVNDHNVGDIKGQDVQRVWYIGISL